MSEIATVDPTLTALVLAEEAACAGYRAARQAQIELARRMASLHRLTVEQPGRADYRNALIALGRLYRGDVKDRTDLAYAKWQQALLNTDGRWSDTTGRTRGQATAGEAA